MSFHDQELTFGERFGGDVTVRAAQASNYGCAVPAGGWATRTGCCAGTLLVASGCSACPASPGLIYLAPKRTQMPVAAVSAA
jgi:hypothetical protein